MASAKEHVPRCHIEDRAICLLQLQGPIWRKPIKAAFQSLLRQTHDDGLTNPCCPCKPSLRYWGKAHLRPKFEPVVEAVPERLKQDLCADRWLASGYMVGNACDGLIHALWSGTHIDAYADRQMKTSGAVPTLQQDAAGFLARDQNIIWPFKANGPLRHMGVNGFCDGKGCDKGQIGCFCWPAAKGEQARCKQIAGFTQPSPAPPAPALGLLKAPHP